ncbi:MAG TPA: type II secretion system protein [Patescibacteria group bacterium]|nr:type II secretion system protein [Patescibacteria group bacterium]
MKNKTAKNHKGFSLVEILIVAGVVGLILTALVLALNSKQAGVRDVKRVSDIKALRSAMEVVKNQAGDYKQTFCQPGLVSSCAKNKRSELTKIMNDLAGFNDPDFTKVCSDLEVCQKAGCNYTFVNLEESDYRVLFTLEKGTSAHPEAGCYELTPRGIKLLRAK